MITAFYVLDKILEKDINIETYVVLLDFANNCMLHQEYSPIFLTLFLKRLNYFDFEKVNLLFLKIIENTKSSYIDKLFSEFNTIYYFNNFLVNMEESILYF